MPACMALGAPPVRPGGVAQERAVAAADVAAYRRDEQQGQSVVKVVAGEKLTEWQALAALLIPSGNNIPDLLAAWDAGSLPAFVAGIDGQAWSLGQPGTP